MDGSRRPATLSLDEWATIYGAWERLSKYWKPWAYAKLNLTLEVLGRRNDGYHEVRTILQTIDLADRLEILAAADLQVECDQPSLSGEANLVWQAAVSLARWANMEPRHI